MFVLFTSCKKISANQLIADVNKGELHRVSWDLAQRGKASNIQVYEQFTTSSRYVWIVKGQAPKGTHTGFGRTCSLMQRKATAVHHFLITMQSVHICGESRSIRLDTVIKKFTDWLHRVTYFSLIMLHEEVTCKYI